jgi:hypothetical protein
MARKAWQTHYDDEDRPRYCIGIGNMSDPSALKTFTPEVVSVRVRFAWYGSIGLVALATAIAGLQLFIVNTTFPFVHWQADLRAPFLYHSDALLILPMVKETVETGTHWRTERLGAPGVQELHDFPVIDHFHFFWLWVMGLILRDPVVVFNVYHLLTYPLAAMVMMAVLRHFSLSMPAAAAGGIIYAFLPYHALRGESHYFLSAYYFVPVTTMLILWICRGELPFVSRVGESWSWSWRSPRTRHAIAISIVTAMAGAYYAFFACALLAPAAIIGWIRIKSWRAAASAGLCIAVIGFVGTLQHLPTFWYQAQYGPNTNPTERYPEEAEYYGLKITHLVLPVTGHNLRPLAWIRGQYNSIFRPNQNENETTSLGLIGTVGLLGLCAVGLFGRNGGWPWGPMATLTIFMLVLSASGGFGSVFNQLVTPQVRCYNRIVVYLAVLTTFAVCYMLDCAFASRSDRIQKFRPLVFLGLGIFAVWDQSGDQWFRSQPWKMTEHLESKMKYRQDRLFFTHVERVLSEGCVFTFPYVPFPESSAVLGVESYSHVRGYLHTQHLRWSFGAMKGREDDTWARQVSLEPPEAMLRRLTYRGFDGLYVDKRGLDPSRADSIIEDFRRVLGSTQDAASAPIVHLDKHQLFFDLRPYRSWLVSHIGAEGYARAAKQEAEQLSILWLKGFPIVEIPGREDKIRKCGLRATMLLINPADRTRTYRISSLIRTDFDKYSLVEIHGGDVWSDRFKVNKMSGPYERTISIPPGRHIVTFRCTPHDTFCPSDHRSLFVNLNQFTAVPLD